MDNAKTGRAYQDFDPGLGYPSAEDLFCHHDRRL